VTEPFIKYIKSEASEFLHSKPIANHVLLIIAYRARRTHHKQNGLSPGQCYMGDHLTIGITRQQYRTAISNLQKWQYITIKATTRGTVATLCNPDAWDININNQPSNQPDINHQPNQSPTIDQPSTQPLTKNDKKETMKECKNLKDSVFFTEFWSVYPGPRKRDKPKAKALFNKQNQSTQELIINHIKHRSLNDPQWLKDNGNFIPGPVPFLNQNGWTDEYRVNELSRFDAKTQKSVGALQEFVNG